MKVGKWSNEAWVNHGVPEPNTGCLLWTGYSDKLGYGRVNINKKYGLLHRLSYEKYKGQIPNGLCVLHKCDTPACFNPDHLFLGTKYDNKMDSIRKGRDPKASATHCKRGHLITGRDKGTQRRRCLKCQSMRSKLYSKGLNVGALDKTNESFCEAALGDEP